jgi:uncharacterized protein YqjF (DUF2071 family)
VADDFRREILDERGHRPWPIPQRPWLMTQTWHDLLFAHWPLPHLPVPGLPSGVELDLFEGQAWVGIVPFFMTNVGLRGLPGLPGMSAFAELNVRTYVTAGNKPGVYFFSLDAASAAAVMGARVLLNLPYHTASMRVEKRREEVRYHSRRRRDSGAVFIGSYAPSGPVASPKQGSLEDFLTERYCLYGVSRRGRPYRLEIHHPPWPLQPAEAVIEQNGMARIAGIDLPPTPPLLHFARRQDMVAWAPTPL